MENSRVRFENRGLLILFSVLCAAIVGLAVGIIVVANHGEDTEDDVATTEYYGGETELDVSIASGYYPGDEMSPEAYEHDYKYLTTMIETSLTNDGQQLNDSDKFFLQMVLTRLMVEYGNGAEALSYLDQIPQYNRTPSQAGELYASYSIAYEQINDQDNAIRYANMASKSYKYEEGTNVQN